MQRVPVVVINLSSSSSRRHHHHGAHRVCHIGRRCRRVPLNIIRVGGVRRMRHGRVRAAVVVHVWMGRMGRCRWCVMRESARVRPCPRARADARLGLLEPRRAAVVLVRRGGVVAAAARVPLAAVGANGDLGSVPNVQLRIADGEGSHALDEDGHVVRVHAVPRGCGAPVAALSLAARALDALARGLVDSPENIGRKHVRWPVHILLVL